MKIVRNLTAVAAVAAALTIASQARADMISFWLTQGECTACTTPGGAPAPISNMNAVEVTVTLNSSTSATVELVAPIISTVQQTINGPVYINVNDGGTVGNVSATYYTGTVADPTLNNRGSATRSDPGQAEDSYGNMNTYTGAFTAATYTFDLTASGLTWTDAAAVLMLSTGSAAAYNGKEFDSAIAGLEGSTQYAGYLTATPLPAAFPLLATGIGALGLLGWRRKRKNADALKAA